MRRRKPPARPERGHPNRPRGGPHAPAGPAATPIPEDPTLIYGRHAVAAALANPERRVVTIRHTAEAAEAVATLLAALPAERRAALPAPAEAERSEIDASLPESAVHQGVVLKVAPLAEPDLDSLLASWEGRPDVLVVMLDQVTDPHNVGAVLRSAAAFGAAALIMQDRHGPPLTGTLAKTASGALDVVPLVRVTNLVRAIRDLQGSGFWCTGLAEEGAVDLASVDLAGRTALVLGAEGSGLRRLTRETCDSLARLPTVPPVGSLNVSAAAAVTLYQARLARSAPGVLQTVKP